jgi:hypothetical protein
MRIGYLECFSGISGDMLLGALVDAGVPFACLAETAAALNVGARLEMRKVSRGGLAAVKVDVITPDTLPAEPEHSHTEHPKHGHHEHEPHAHTEHPPHRSLSAILEIIQSAPLSGAVKKCSMRAFQLLGEAEATIHSVPIEEVHFHEVGAVDTIVDIVCAAAGAEALGVDRWISSSLNVGSGTVVCQHGTLPVPAPATLSLLGDAPVYAAGEPMERVTPTGAVLLRMLDVQFAKLPAMRVLKTGYGAGGRETAGQPNLLRLLVGEEEAAETAETESIAVIEKKGRTGVQMTVLCRPDLAPALQNLLFRETTTIGLRWRLENKVALAREFVEVETIWGKVKIKIARWPDGKIANAAPEYEDCRQLAASYLIPLKRVMEEAMRVYALAKENG